MLVANMNIAHGKKIHAPQHHSWESRLLAWLLGLYILFCFIIAGLNYGYGTKAGPELKALIGLLWHIYENEFKTLLILVASLLSWRIARRQRQSAMFKRNLIGLCIAAILLHIVGPLLSGTHELYFFAMPFPWTSVPLQVLDPTSPFFGPRAALWGSQGAMVVLGFWLAMGLVVLVGTVLWGRRWQCSTLCLFNGFAAEVFAPVFPLIGHPRHIGPKLRRLFRVARWLILGIALFYSAYWIVRVLGFDLLPSAVGRFIVGIETWKYLLLELLMAMFCWLVLSGRGYCQYCSLGTVLSGIGRLAGQRIATTKESCVSCGACTRTCPMGIDVMQAVQSGQPSVDSRCVGCGHCVDRCQTISLRYTTRFLEHRQK